MEAKAGSTAGRDLSELCKRNTAGRRTLEHGSTHRRIAREGTSPNQHVVGRTELLRDNAYTDSQGQDAFSERYGIEPESGARKPNVCAALPPREGSDRHA